MARPRPAPTRARNVIPLRQPRAGAAPSSPLRLRLAGGVSLVEADDAALGAEIARLEAAARARRAGRAAPAEVVAFDRHPVAAPGWVERAGPMVGGLVFAVLLGGWALCAGAAILWLGGVWR